MIHKIQSKHETIAEFWFVTAAILFFIAFALFYGKSIIFGLVSLLIGVVSVYRNWLSLHQGKDIPAQMQKILLHFAEIALFSLLGPFLLLGYPYYICKYIKARRSPYN
jgi:hypothetical protein